jgi:hypothetical protein
MMGRANEGTMADYTYWAKALELLGGTNRSLTRDEMIGLGLTDDAGLGFFRKRVSRGGAYVPVALWESDGKIIAVVDGKEADPDVIWSYAAAHPVTEAAYHERVDTGKWSDEDASIQDSLTPPAMGDNNPPQDEATILKGMIDAAKKNAADYVDIKDDATAAKAQSVRSRLLELAGNADKAHDKEKAPFLEAGRAVDKRWFPLRDTAKAAADAIRTALSAHERRKEAERAKAEDARIAAEKEAERVRAAAIEAGKPAPAPVPVPPPAAPVAQPTTIQGAYGRAASIKTITVVTVTDQDAAYQYLKASADVVEAIAKAAKRAVTAGQTVPGTTVTQEKDVR